MFAEYPPGLVSTVLSEIYPGNNFYFQILLERGVNYGALKHLLASQLKDIKQEILASKSQFCSAGSLLESLYSACYFKDKDGKFHWPKLFQEIADECKFFF